MTPPSTSRIQVRPAAEREGRKDYISIRDYGFWYGQKKALEAISLDIPERQVVAFIGPSGCGKSTLLRNLNRMNDLVDGIRHEGDITINGSSIGAISADTTAAARGQQVSVAINLVTSTTGVTATYDAITGAVALSSASGNDIVLATTANAAETATGLGASGTVSGDVSIVITATDTVAAITAKINTANAGVLATMFNDGSNDRLLLRSNSTGTTGVCFIR